MTDGLTGKQEYLERLILSLRVRDVSPERIKDVLQEVEGHLEASGEDPMEAFGSTSQLADALVQAHPVSRSVRLQPLSMAATVVGSFLAPLLTLSGGFAMITGNSVAITVAAVAGVAVALLGIFVALPLVRGYFDGRRRLGTPVGVLTVGFTFGIGLAVAVDGPVAVDAPGWALLVAGVVCLAAVATLVKAEPLLPRDGDGDPPLQARRTGALSPRGASNLRGLVHRTEARLTARMLDSASFRFVIVTVVIVGGALGGAALAVAVEDPSPAATLVAGLVLGGLIGHLIGTARIRRRYGLTIDRQLD